MISIKAVFENLTNKLPIASVTIINIVARASHLALFLVIGNYFGISAGTEIVFFLYAPLAVIMSVALGVTDVVVMPAMHKAELIQSSGIVEGVFYRFALQVIPIATIAIMAITWLLVPQASVQTILLLAPIPLVSSFSSIYIGLLNSQGKHNCAVLGPVYGSIISLLVVFVFPPSAESLALILLLFECGRAFGLRFHVIKKDKKLVNITVESKRLIHKVLKDQKWQAVGSFLISLNPLIDIFFARTLEIGSVTSVEYTSRLWNLVPLFFTGLIITTYAKMSRAAAINCLEEGYVKKTAAKVGIFAVILSILMIIFSKPLIVLLYSYGSIDPQSHIILSNLLSVYLLGAGPFIAGMIYSRAFSAQRRISLLASVALVSVLCNLIFNFIFIKYFGIYGIALATAMSHLISLILFMHFFKSNKI